MKKNLLALLLLITMLFNMFAMTGCIGGGGDDGEYEEGKVNITFYHTMGKNLQEVLEYYVEDFEELYPFINVIHSQEGGYDDVRDKISNELFVGEHPNIAYCYPDHVALYNVAKAVTVLDSYIDFNGSYTFADGNVVENIGLTQAQKDDFIQGYYNEGRQFGDGKMYTLPLSKSTEVLYYNKTFFTENNIEVPTHWWCNETCPAECKSSLEYVCAQIKGIDSKSIPLGYDSEANWFITMCEQLGENNPYTSADKSTGHFLFDDADNHAFVKEFAEWYSKGYLTTQDLYGAYTSGLFVSTGDQKSYMSIGSSAGATHQAPESIKFEVGIAPIPQADPNNNKVISQGPSLCIFEDADKDKVMASWLFVKFLTTNVNFQAEFSEASGYVPVIKSVANDPDYAAFLADANGYNSGIAALSAKVCLEQESYYYTSPAFNGSSVARDQVGALLKKCLVDAADAIQKGNTDAQVMAIIEAAFEDAVKKCKYEVGN